jgi:hypothetical protein
MQTFSQIISQFSSSVQSIPAVNTFAYGSLDKLDSTTQNVSYPYVFVRPITSPGLRLDPNGITGTHSLTFEVYSLAVPTLTESDYLSVMSTTEQVIYDIVAQFNYGVNQQDTWLLVDNIAPVNEAFNDRTYGWVATLQFQEPTQLNAC